MKVTLNWLREFVPIEVDTETLCRRLSMAGLEVEEVQEVGADIRSVVVAEIVRTEPHPTADRLTVCRVRTGPESPVAVVCGARNMTAGDRVAYAPPGTVLPGGSRIETCEIRGVSSRGMLCSDAELGMAEEADGILILPADAQLGMPVGRCLGVEDTVLDIGVTPNRGDCLSILGIAREIAALTGARLLRRRRKLKESGPPVDDAVTVAIEDPDGCGRYAARIVRGIRVGSSPLWMQTRLLAVGLRPINNAVDVTNYVMLERGQPLHAFDYDRLSAPRIVVRRAGASRTIVTLDDRERELREDDLLITTGEDPVAIAGVMGGANSEVADGTTTVLLESAWFEPASIRRTARRLDLHSESSFRFERGVDIGGVPAALDRAAALLQESAGGTVAPGMVDVFPASLPDAPIHVRMERVEEILGLRVSGSDAGAILKKLGAKVSSAPRRSMTVVPPTWRSDLTREIDVIEEIARVIGYDRIPATMPSAGTDVGTVPQRWVWASELRRLLTGYGLHEVISLTFTAARANECFPGVGVDGDPVVVANPVSREETQLRRSLVPGLVGVWKLNKSHGATGVAAFEIGKVFWKGDDFREGWRLGCVMAERLAVHGLGAGRDVEYADAKGVVEAVLDRLHVLDRVRWEPLRDARSFHPGKTAALRIGEEQVGFLGCLHPDREAELGVAGANWFFELEIDRLLAYVPSRRFFHELPRFPAVVRDLAVVVDMDFPADRVLHFVRAKKEQWMVEEITFFDEYTGDPIPAGRKSLAYSISYRAADRTLTDEEVNRLHVGLTESLSRELPVELR